MNYYNEIENYCEGLLSEEVKITFESAMIDDVHLAELVHEYQDAKKIAEGLLEIDIMKTIGDFRKGKNTKKTIKEDEKRGGGSKYFSIRRMSIAASMIGLLGMGAWWFTSNIASQKQKEEVWANYVKPIDTEATKSSEVLGMNTFQKGKYYFALNDFEISEKWLGLFISQTSNKDSLSSAYFWLGAAHIEQWELSEAKEAWGKSSVAGSKSNLELIE